MYRGLLILETETFQPMKRGQKGPKIPSPLRERARACPVLDTGVRVIPQLTSL